MEQIKQAHSEKNWYDKSYKWLLIPTTILFIISILYLVNFYNTNGDIIYKDVSLTGGTTISVFDKNVDVIKLKDALRESFPDLNVRIISNMQAGGQSGFTVETKENVDIVKPKIEEYLGYKLISENSSIEFSSSNLSAGFYQQLRNSLIAAFLLMSWVVFFVFGASKKITGITLMLTALGIKITLAQVGLIKIVAIFAILIGFFLAIWHSDKKDRIRTLLISLIILGIFFFYAKLIILIPLGIVLIGLYAYYSMPSVVVILCAFADIVMTIAVVDYMGINLSTAGIVAFLMLIGYSVDTDILMTTRLLKKKEGNVNSRLYGAFKTGMTMTLTSIASVGAAYIVIGNSSETLKQIFTILLIGLSFDIINTWITNASILRWYMGAKKLL
ncbi:MAG: hypothetical protein Q8L29_02055 [archaeon]|nr:hypothetical protein [archaeon]